MKANKYVDILGVITYRNVVFSYVNCIIKITDNKG
jgi:hypothetical protein